MAPRMRIREFIDKYCMDIVAESKKKQSLLDSDDFSYDEIIYEPDGTPVKIVYAGDDEIPIADILGLDKEEYVKIYPSFKAQQAYDDYVESIVMLEGEEALMFYRNEMLKERARIMESASKFIDAL